MSYYATWFLVLAPAGAVERHGPALRAQLAEHAAAPGTRALWRRWEREELGFDELEALASGPFGLDVEAMYAVWEDCAGLRPYGAVSARNRFPMLGLAHALGPERIRELPGWFGDLVLSPDEVRSTLPAVEALFALDGAARVEAERRAEQALRSADPVGDLFDTAVPIWRAAAEGGHGLIGAQIVP
ncbi:hypothetical protein VM98_10775 [Streptomyces rubellomurinus subsp. indigoferus]|uniref:Uncharacterized protein n=1 Tax=Streptomyces rubellomurinus (strain ATCC 31215) TaxID=359131 RepID=A0A0F2TIX2_STRR3|nr:hypothetical protein [Streptomyces rubellomurinus]KJS55830.1 hypothetical protein VM98_10775 [Streptomyces rubellomurinus subsp. indigoferus]KJS63104.1 hypothetical protein VM95_05190 [Streptomyces rubellomurinus]